MRQFLKNNLWEIIAGAGFALIVSGIASVDRAAALVVAGAGLMVLGLWGAKAWASSDEPSDRRR